MRVVVLSGGPGAKTSDGGQRRNLEELLTGHGA